MNWNRCHGGKSTCGSHEKMEERRRRRKMWWVVRISLALPYVGA
jgi:hypothetical protein